MKRWMALGLLLFMALGAVAPAASQGGADQGKLKAEVKRWLKEHLVRPESYKGEDWGQVVSHEGGGRSYSIRHVYQYEDRSGQVHTEDRIFAFDVMGRISGVESTAPGGTPRWHNHRP
jgi:hypothetical protein